MLSLAAKIRKELGKKVKNLRKKGIIPAVLYGPKMKKTFPLEIDEKQFEKVYKEAGESSIIKLKIKNLPRTETKFLVRGEKSPKESLRLPTGQVKIDEFLVLIHEIQLDPLTEKPIHVDFYQPSLEEEIEASVPIIFEGEAKAVKDLGGTLIKNISEVVIKAFPQDLPKEIKVNVEGLKTFKDNILIKDLKLPERVKILKDPEEIVANIASPEKVEEELVKPIEEKVEEVEKVEEKEEEEIK